MTERSGADATRRSAIGRDAARIVSDLTASASGSDPFIAAVRATQMPMVVTAPREPNNPVVFANDAFCRLCGYAREDIIGRNCRFLQGTDTDPAAVGRIRSAVAAADPLEIDLLNYRKSGEAFWNRLLMGPVFDDDGQLLYFFASQIDVTTEHARLAGLEHDNAVLTAELAGLLRAQRESEERLRFAAKAGRLGIWELDLKTGGLSASAVSREIFGRGPSDSFAFDDLRQAVHPDDRDRVSAALEQSITTGADHDMDYRIVRPDGSIGWVEVRAQVVRADDGTPLRLAGISLDITAQRTTGLRLELSEEALRLATEAAELGTWDLDPTTGLLTWSDRTRAMFGLATESVPLADFFAALPPEDIEPTSAAFAAALDPAIRAPFDIEYRAIGQDDGAVRWIAARGKALFDDNDRCVRAIGTALDITVRKAAAERLHVSEAMRADSEAKFRAITDSIDQMIWSARADGHHDFFNQRWYDFTGVPPGSTDGAGWNAISHPDDRERADALWQTSLAAGTPYEIEYRMRHRSGVFRWVLGRAVALRSGGDESGGDIVRWFGTCTDIQEIVEARNVLARSREDLEREVTQRTRERDRVWANAQDLLAVLDGDGIFRAASPAWEKILGWKPEEVVGRSHLYFHAAEDVEASRAALAQAMSGTLHGYEGRMRHRDGSYRWFSWVSSTEDGLAYVSGRNVTVEKAAAAELEAAQDQLRQAQKMEAVGQLTGGIAHDFNNLLQIVVGNLEMIQRSLPEDGGRLRRSADNAMTGAKRAATLTQRLLAFSRRQPLAPKPVDLNALVGGMSDMLARALGETIDLRTMLAPGLWPAEADPNQLENALLNLAVNARDAMAAGGTLTIETSNVHHDAVYARANAEVRAGDYVVIAVTDSGEGMDKATMARVFEPFFTTKEVGKGTGLGLAMVHGFVNQSGGHVKLYSEAGQGTTVRLYLPRLVAALVDEEPGRGASVGGSVPSETILVVEDDEDVRASSVEILRDLGYRVLEAADGPSALAVLEGPQGRAVDLLFTDVVLPGGMTGADIARSAAVLYPGLAILFTTGYARNAIVHQGRLDDGVHLITKPFAYDDLAAKLRQVLDGG